FRFYRTKSHRYWCIIPTGSFGHVHHNSKLGPYTLPAGKGTAREATQTALRRGDNVTNEALPRCVYCWLKTFPNCPRWPLKHGCHTQFLNAPRGQRG
ncbi:unnamed protein product, partial [Haemonchus placei]|uniref:FLYWCH-type domain-containing protein n=1 Tax=Haemonchus placei TaxID=6290 RepID=A0A0N4WH41_HAEPC